MRIRYFYFVAFLATVLAISSCGGVGNAQVRLNEEFYLSPGQHVFIAGENLEVKFKEVVEDSRCPRGATCVWAGRVTCALELAQAGVSNQMSLTTKPGLTDEYSRERHQGYEFAFQVTPYPQVGEKIPTGKYRLHLIVSKLSEPTKIGSIMTELFAFEGRDITVIGYYRGWDLLQEANMTPPVTRSD